MKLISSLVLVSCLVGSLALAADSENSGSSTTDTSKNPVTGTVMKTQKVKRKVKNKDGAASQVEVTDTTKTKKNGEVKEDVKVDSDAKPAK